MVRRVEQRAGALEDANEVEEAEALRGQADDLEYL